MKLANVFAKATAAVESLYDKTATISRQVPYEKLNGADGMKWKPIHSSVPCRLSSVTLNNTNQEEANTINYDVKLFLSSDFEIDAGDEIVVGTEIDGEILNSETYKTAKEPFVYVSHQEVLLVRQGYA